MKLVMRNPESDSNAQANCFPITFKSAKLLQGLESSKGHSSYAEDMQRSSGSDAEIVFETSEEEFVFGSSSSDEIEEFSLAHPLITRNRRKRPKHGTLAFSLGAILTATFITMLCAAEDELSGTSLSTGVALIALGAPSLLAKLLSLVRRFPQMPSVCGCFFFLLGGLACNLSESVSTRVAGLCMISLGTGLGEVAVHTSIEAELTKQAYSVFLGGTGVAGVLGGLVYVGLTAWAPVDPRTVTLLSALWPVTLFLTFAMLKHKLDRGAHKVNALRELRWSPLTARGRSTGLNAVRSTLRQLSLLFVVYFSVYLSLGAVLTTVVLGNVGDAPEYFPRGHFLHYVLSTLVGEFLGRTFMSMLCAVAPGFHFVASPLLAVLPVVQAIFFVISAWYRVIPYLWIYWLLCFIMGTSSGITYVNSIHAITNSAIPTHRSLLLTCATAAESAGVFIAGLLGLYIEPALQEHCLHSYGNQTCLTRSEDAMFWINGRLQ